VGVLGGGLEGFLGGGEEGGGRAGWVVWSLSVAVLVVAGGGGGRGGAGGEVGVAWGEGGERRGVRG